MRSLYSSILLSNTELGAMVLLVSSALPGEGKTTVAANLAVGLSRHGKTCLVDADLRRSCIRRMFNLSEGHGLSDVLSGDVDFESALTDVPEVPNLQVVQEGTMSGNTSEVVELMLSGQMRKTINALRQGFEFVVIDSAPVLANSEVRALSTLADRIIFVSRLGITTRYAMARSIELLTSSGCAPISEIVLNGADRDSDSYKYYRCSATA